MPDPETETEAKEKLRDRRWWMLFGAIHAKRGSKLRKQAEHKFVELSKQLEREERPKDR